MSQQLYSLSLDAIKYICNLINQTVDLPSTILDDLNIATNTTYSSYRLDTLLKALKDENIKYCDEAIAGLNKTFYKKVYKVVRRRCNISFYFNAYDITFIRSNIEKELERTDLSFMQERNNLNKKVKERVLKNAEDRKEKAENGDIRRADVKLRRSEDFIENINKLIDTVIDMSAKNIVAELKSLNEKNSNKQKNVQHSSI